MLISDWLQLPISVELTNKKVVLYLPIQSQLNRDQSAANRIQGIRNKNKKTIFISYWLSLVAVDQFLLSCDYNDYYKRSLKATLTLGLSIYLINDLTGVAVA